MSSVREVVSKTADATLKGRVLAAVGAANQGSNDVALLNLNVGALVAGETFSLGVSRFEWVDISTAETATGSAAAAGTPNITLNQAPDRDFVVGEVFAIDTEYCKVTSYVAGSLVVGVERGYAGSTAAIQSADVILRSAAANVNGNLLIPVNDGTQAEAAAKTITAVPALVPAYGARSGGANAVLFDVAYAESHPANSIVSANSNTLANFAGGEDTLSQAKGRNVRVLSAGDATAGSYVVVFPFTPAGFSIRQYEAASGAEGAAGTIGTLAGRQITVAEGAAAWTAGDVVVLEAFA
jgi:hypothetical protein